MRIYNCLKQAVTSLVESDHDDMELIDEAEPMYGCFVFVFKNETQTVTVSVTESETH
jgi:hypothetical protein